MQVRSIFVILLCATMPLFGAPPQTPTPTPPPSSPESVEDGNVIRARGELNRVRALVDAGVLPRARLQQAEDALADTQADTYIRTLLYKQDITVEQADELVSLTNHRVGRRQGVVEAKTKLVQAGIMAKDEMANDLSSLGQAQSQHTWALSRQQLAHELADLVKGEQEAMQQMELAARGLRTSGAVEHFAGSNRFDMAQFAGIDKAFEARFARALPVSAMGETEVHRSLGFDHRNRVDIALQPDLPEGRWLRTYLASHNIPYFAFRTALAGQATGAHIHIGPPSLRYYAQSNSKPHLIAGED